METPKPTLLIGKLEITPVDCGGFLVEQENENEKISRTVFNNPHHTIPCQMLWTAAKTLHDIFTGEKRIAGLFPVVEVGDVIDQTETGVFSAELHTTLDTDQTNG